VCMCVQPIRPWLNLVYLDMFSVVHLSGPVYRVCWLGLVCPSRLAGPGGPVTPGWLGRSCHSLDLKACPHLYMCNALPQVCGGPTTPPTPPTMSLGEIGPLQDVPRPRLNRPGPGNPGHTGIPLIRGMTPRTGTLSVSPRSCMCPGPRPGLHTSRPRFITTHAVWCNQGTTRLELWRVSACNIIVSPPCAILDRWARRA
jgi:hypothetical protein